MLNIEEKSKSNLKADIYMCFSCTKYHLIFGLIITSRFYSPIYLATSFCPLPHSCNPSHFLDLPWLLGLMAVRVFHHHPP